MNKTSIKKIQQKLISQYQELLKNLNQEQQEIDISGDDIDAIQGRILANTINQLNLREAQKLQQIEKALTKIQNKTFGICEDCDGQIADKRLETNPHLTLCIDCAEDREQVMKRATR